VIRPPAEDAAQPLDLQELETIREKLGNSCEIIADFEKLKSLPSAGNIEEAVLEMIHRRPVTISDMASTLGKHRDEITKYVNRLLKAGKIVSVTHKSKRFFKPGPSKGILND
jgi:hypothetical protein